MFTIAFGIAVFLLLAPKGVSALSGSEFQAGRIMDDGIFFNSNALSAGDIQAFLNSKVPNCDTNGSQSYGGTTRAAYGASKGYPAPYICLRNYTQATPTKAAEAGLCNQFNGGTKSAAQIIYDVGKACGISQKVLIVLLEKEQSLITDDWPWSIQYRSATGYGCPDTAPCDAEYYGFFNQVYSAARQFKNYQKRQDVFSYKANRTNYIQFNPNANCGGSNVFIQNQATAGLYNYTPYQPNSSALANLYGAGDACGAYGNRNFWRLFITWFGSPYADCVFPHSTNTSEIYRLYYPAKGGQLLTSSASEVCAATRAGYLFDGALFSLPTTGEQTTPVFRLEQQGRYLMTSSVSERDAAVTNYGYRYDGVAFYTINASSSSTDKRPVYRLANAAGYYFYTLSTYERDAAVSIYGYRYEGVGFYLNELPGAAVVDVSRLSNPSGTYLYTISNAEIDYAVSNFKYTYQGTGFRAINRMNPITVPVFRLAGKNGYFYTTNLSERMYAVNIGYRDEGIAMFTYGFGDSSLKHLFRLVGKSGNYFYTTSVAERDNAVQTYGYRYEGVGFQTP